MGSTGDFQVLFKQILLRNGVPTKDSTSEKRDGNVCPEHSKYAVPSLTLQNHGCNSCAKLNKPSLEQISRDIPSMEQTSHDNPSLVETSHCKPCLEQTLHKNPFFLPDSSGKPPLEQLKQFSDRTRVGNLHGFNHLQHIAHRRKQQAVGQRSNRKKEKVCPEHSSYALPSLTLQNHGCKSCAMLNSEEKGHNFHNRGKSYFEQTKQSSRPFKEKTDDFPGATEHNQYGFNRSQNTVPRGKRYSQRPKTVQAGTREICEILALSRTFYKQASLESHARDFDGAGVNPYHENSPVYEKYEDNYDSSSGSQHGMKKSLGNPWGDSKWKPRSAKYDNRR